MNDSFKNLIEQFNIISKKCWIPSVKNNFGSVGLTFEKELGKKADSMYFPDYENIEIKCTSRFSRYPLFLFTVAFDGPTFPEIDRIVEKYGYADKDFPEKKVIFETVNYKTLHYVNNKFKFKLDIDEKEEKLYLCVYDLNNKLIEKTSFVYLSTIYHHIMVKLKYLAIIYASQKKENNMIFLDIIN